MADPATQLRGATPDGELGARDTLASGDGEPGITRAVAPVELPSDFIRSTDEPRARSRENLDFAVENHFSVEFSVE